MSLTPSGTQWGGGGGVEQVFALREGLTVPKIKNDFVVTSY